MYCRNKNIEYQYYEGKSAIKVLLPIFYKISEIVSLKEINEDKMILSFTNALI